MPPERLPRVRLRRWTVDDLDVLQGLNTPEVKRYLGGPESPSELRNRNLWYATIHHSGNGHMFVIVRGDRRVGSIGFWTINWRGEPSYETGWGVLPEFQGRGIGLAATLQVIAMARAEGRHRYLLALPRVENAASNTVCRNAGFTLVGQCDHEFPTGVVTPSYEWRFDLQMS